MKFFLGTERRKKKQIFGLKPALDDDVKLKKERIKIGGTVNFAAKAIITEMYSHQFTSGWQIGALRNFLRSTRCTSSSFYVQDSLVGPCRENLPLLTQLTSLTKQVGCGLGQILIDIDVSVDIPTRQRLQLS